MLEAKIVQSTKEDWYYKFQFKNNKQKTFNVVPNKEFDKFVVSDGEFKGKEINPAHVHAIKAEHVLKIFKNVRFYSAAIN